MAERRASDNDAYSRLMSGTHPHYIYQYDSYARVMPAEAEPGPAPAQDPRRRVEAPPQAAPAPKPAPARRRRRAMPKFEFSFGHTRKTALGTYLLVTVLALCGLGVLAVQGALAQGAMELRTLRSAIDEQRADNYAMQIQLYNTYDKDELARLAAERLGMVKPAEHQFVHIPASRADYATQFDGGEQGGGTIKERLGAYLELLGAWRAGN